MFPPGIHTTVFLDHGKNFGHSEAPTMITRSPHGACPPPLSTMSSLWNVLALGLVAFLATAIRARAAAEDSISSTNESRYLPWEKGSVRVGGFVAAFDTTVALGLNNEPGVKINGEGQLGLDSSLTVFRADAMYRPGKSRRNELDFSYAAYDRTGDATLTRDLTIRGTTYTIGTEIKTVLNFDIIQGSYSYALIQNERMRIALGVGIYVVPLKTGLDITTTRGGSVSEEGADTTVPLPVIGLRTEFQLLPRLYLNAGIDAFYLEITGFRGSMLDVFAGLEYRPWKHLGVGLGYNFTGMQIDTEKSNSDYPGANFVANVDVNFSGLLVYGKFSF